MNEAFQELVSALASQYRIRREVARGGMATVWLADDIKHDRLVAIKVFDPDFSRSVGRERFLSEIAIVARLNHPNILPLHDSGAVGTYLYYIMPYMSGGSLRDVLSLCPKLEPRQAIRITTEIADALDYAHRSGVIHRDVKPGNILFAQGHALIADFGIAKLMETTATSMTATGHTPGTPMYMSPEQASGRTLDGRSDEYSLACVTYEMIAGTPPFVGTSLAEIIQQHIGQAPRPLTEAVVGIRQNVADAVERALAKVPDERFPTTSAFATAMATDLPLRVRRIRPRPVLLGGMLALLLISFAILGELNATWHNRKDPESAPGEKVRSTSPAQAESRLDSYLTYLSATNRKMLDAERVFLVVVSLDKGNIVGFGVDGDGDRDALLSEQREPVSLVNPLIVAAGLDIGAVQDTTWLVTGESAQFGKFAVHDSRPLRGMPVSAVLPSRSLIGTAKIAERMGRQSVINSLERFGVLQDSAATFLAKDDDPVGLLGYGFQTSASALIEAYRRLGEVAIPGREGTGAVTPATSLRIREWMAEAVEKGPGSDASLPRIGVSGRTSTRQLFDRRSHTYTAEVDYSMIAIVPTYSPRYVVMAQAQKVPMSGSVKGDPCAHMIRDCTRYLLER